MSIEFHRLIEAIDNNRLIIIDFIDYIDCMPIIDFHRLGGIVLKRTAVGDAYFPFVNKWCHF